MPIDDAGGSHGFRTAVYLYWTAYLTVQFTIASRLTIDHYDAFQYLCNARRLAGSPVMYNAVFRPPLIPLLHAPFQKLLDLLHAGTRARLEVPHLIQALLSAACLAAFYRYLRNRSFQRRWAHVGVILFSLDRLTIHYFSSALPDIPCALFLLFFLIFLNAERLGFLSVAVAAAALGACLLGRWNMLIVPALIACALLARFGHEKQPPSLWKFLAAGYGGAILALAAYAAVYRRVYGLTPTSGLHFLADNFRSASVVNQAVEHKDAYLGFLWTSAGPAAAAAFVAGFLACLKNAPGAFAVESALFLGFFCVMSFTVGHKEARYLYPALPFYYFFVLHGVKILTEQCGRFLPSKTAAEKTLLACFLAAGAVSAAREWAQFRDPAFRDPILFDLLGSVQSHRKPGETVYWNGRAHSISPQNCVFRKDDAFYYLYHVPNLESLEYFLGEDVRVPRDKSAMRPGDLLVRVPSKIRMIDESISKEENKITLYQMSKPDAPLETLDVFY